MTLDEAIRTLMVTERDNTTTFWIKAKQAVQLGIEATGVVEAIRNLDGYPSYTWAEEVRKLTDLLPSESKEE